MSTTCGPKDSLSVRVEVRWARTRPLSYSPQITIAAPERSPADEAERWSSSSSGHSTVLMLARPAEDISRSMLVRRRPRMLNPCCPAV